MTKPQDPRADEPSAHGQRLRRLFHFEGSLGGLRYQARLGIFELKDPTTVPIESDAGSGRGRALLAGSARDSRTTASELDTWESEGGSSGRPES